MPDVLSASRRFAVALSLVAACAAPALAADMIGNCELTGQKGQFSITPAMPGQLTVEVNLPAPGLWNGDTPETIKDGFEYCLAANIAHRARAGQGRRGQRRLGCAGRRPDQGLRPGLVAGLDHRRAQEGGRLLGALLLIRHRRAGEEGQHGRRAIDQGEADRRAAGDYRCRPSSRTSSSPTTPPKVFPDTPSMFTALQANQVDAAMTDTAIVLSQAAASNGKVEVVGQYSTGETYGAHLSEGLGQRGCARQGASSP